MAEKRTSYRRFDAFRTLRDSRRETLPFTRPVAKFVALAFKRASNGECRLNGIVTLIALSSGVNFRQILF
jgi:hypothetical protein